MASPYLIPVLNIVGDVVKHAFRKKNLKSKTAVTSFAAAATASQATAAATTGFAPGIFVFPDEPMKQELLNYAYYGVSAFLTLLFAAYNERKDTA